MRHGSDSVSKQILEIRARAGNPNEICPTCNGTPYVPYRTYYDDKIDAGCIDPIHTGHIYGESLRWHERPSAKKWRRDELRHLKSVGRRISKRNEKCNRYL